MHAYCIPYIPFILVSNKEYDLTLFIMALH